MPFTRRIWLVAALTTTCVMAVGIAVALGLGSKTYCIVTGAFQNHSPQIAPKVVVKKPVVDIGRIDSSAAFRNTFAVRNEGSAPLKVSLAEGLCKCLTVQLPNEPVAPGQSAEIRVESSKDVEKETMAQGAFSRTVRLLTNDPQRNTIELTINATVISRLTASPSPITLAIDASQIASKDMAAFAFAASDPNARYSRTAETVVYSQRWERFELAVNKTSRAGILWKIEPATKQQLDDLAATSGYRVVITMPSEMPDGRFADWIEFSGRSPSGGTASNAIYRFEIMGNVGGRFILHNRKLVNGETLQLGAIQRGEAVREQLIVKINDKERDIHVEKIETSPEFLRVRFQPYAKESTSKIGLYRLEVEVPGDAPTCDFSGKKNGFVRLRTNHPRLPVIEVKVDFMVTAN